jgi:outer membrane immunogenic protein
MKNYCIGFMAFTLTSVAALASANAADMYRAPEPVMGGGYKDGPVAQTWTGFYAGINGGGAWDSSGSNLTLTSEDINDPTLNQRGGFLGGQIGYNWQRDRIVYGIEADLQGAWIGGKTSASLPDGDGPIVANAASNLDWFGTIRGRLGYAFDRGLLYGTGGFAFGGVRDRLSIGEQNPAEGLLASDKKDKTATGFAVGGGVEYPLSPAWSVKGEYQYIDLGSTSLTASKSDPDEFIKASIKIDHTYNTIRLGLNYHILPGYEPLK